MTRPPRLGWLFRSLTIEWLFATAVAGGMIYCIGHLLVAGYVPAPLFYDSGDTWMDWFNTAAYAVNGGAYVAWHSIYPPLSFVFLRLTSIDSCFDGVEAGFARRCDWLGVATLHGFYLANMVIAALTYLRIDRRTAIPRALAVAVGLPMLTALDRGNLVVVCFTCFALAFGPLLGNARIKAVAAGLAVNFKVYLIAAILPHLLRRRWRWVEMAVLSTIVVYLVTYAWYGSGTPGEIVRNIIEFADAGDATNFLDGWAAGTYKPILNLLTNPVSPIVSVLGSSTTELLIVLIPLMTMLAQGLIVVAATMVALRPEAVPAFRLTTLGVCLALITSESTSYTNAFVLFLVFMERWRGPGRITALVAAYLLALPLDIIMFRLSPINRHSFFIDREILASYAVTYGPLFRPGLLLLIGGALACATIADVWRDVRRQGWRDRRRFRRDLPLLLAGGRTDTAASA